MRYAWLCITRDELSTLNGGRWVNSVVCAKCLNLIHYQIRIHWNYVILMCASNLLTFVDIQIIGVMSCMLNAQQPRSHYFDPSLSMKPQSYFFYVFLN